MYQMSPMMMPNMPLSPMMMAPDTNTLHRPMFSSLPDMRMALQSPGGPMRRHTWQVTDYQAIIEAARSGLDTRGISTELGMPAATVRAVLEKAQRDPTYAAPRPRGGAHNLVYDRESVLDALRVFLVRPENGGSVIQIGPKSRHSDESCRY